MGTLVCGGLSTVQALGILRELAPIDFVAMDIAEVASVYDIGNIAALAARLSMLACNAAAGDLTAVGTR